MTEAGKTTTIARKSTLIIFLKLVLIAASSLAIFFVSKQMGLVIFYIMENVWEIVRWYELFIISGLGFVIYLSIPTLKNSGKRSFISSSTFSILGKCSATSGVS